MNWVYWLFAVLAVLVGVSLSAEAVLEAHDRARFPPPGQLVEVQGRHLSLVCKGHAAGPTVIVEQGAGSPSTLWWPLQDRLAAFTRVCTYDRAGYQWSDPVEGERTLEARVKDLHSVLQAARVPGPYVLVGHSYGGPLVRLYTHLYPTEVVGLVLVDTPEEAVILRPSYDEYAKKIRYFAKALEIASRFGLIRVAAAFMNHVPAGMDEKSYQAMKAAMVRPDFFRAMGDDPISLSKEPETLRQLSGAGSLKDLPVVVITHRKPFPGPAAVLEEGWIDGQRRLADLSSRGELLVAEQSNHMIPLEEPDIIVNAIRSMTNTLTLR